MVRRIKEHRYFIFGIIIIFFVLIVNRFPSGYVVVGGDTAQLIEVKQNFLKVFYSWQGRNQAFFYLPFLLVDLLGISENVQLSLYLGIFLLASYISFDIFLRLVFRRGRGFLRMSASLFYALNLYTLYIFTYAWGYSAYQFFYVFIPVLVGILMRYCRLKTNIWAAYFIIAIFFASTGFSNPAFALSFAIVMLIFLFFLATIGEIKIDKQLFGGIILLALLSLAVNSYWIMSTIAQSKEGLDNIASGETLDLNWWIRVTSNRIVDTVRLSQSNNMYFPDNFPYPQLMPLKGVYLLLSALPFFLILLGLVNIRSFKQRNRRLYVAATASLLVLVALVARVRFPFVTLNDFLFNIPGLTTLRSYEKFAIFIPFLFALLLYIAFSEIWDRRRKAVVIIGMVTILAAPLPFYIGRLQQNMSAKFASDPLSKRDYQSARYSFLVKIPKQYYQVRDIINGDPQGVHIASLPFNMKETYGWQNFEKWKMIGVDVTRYLYNKEIIDSNNIYFDEWLYAKDLNNSDKDDDVRWVAKLLGLMNVKYVIYHKDVENEFIEKSINKINLLEDEGLFSRITGNDYFELYQIDQGLVLPFISWQTNDEIIYPSPQEINDKFDRLREDIVGADYNTSRVDKYHVIANPDERKKLLVLAEPYSDSWKARAVLESGETVLLDHFVARGYANGWKMDEKLDVKEVIIDSYPLSLISFGFGVSGITLIIIIIYIINYHVVTRKKNL